MPNIYFVGGEKGGVGKSHFSRCLAQYFLSKGWKFYLVEADETVPDVGRIYGNNENCLQVVFSDSKYRIGEPDVIFNKAKELPVIVNLPSNVYLKLNDWIAKSRLLNYKQEFEGEVYKFFVTDGCYESIRLFIESVEKFKGSLPHLLIRNPGRLTASVNFNYLQEETKFVEVISSYNIPVFDLPELASSEQFYVDKKSLTYSQAIDLAKADGNTMGAGRIFTFLEEVEEVFDKIFDGPNQLKPGWCKPLSIEPTDLSTQRASEDGEVSTDEVTSVDGGASGDEEVSLELVSSQKLSSVEKVNKKEGRLPKSSQNEQ